MTTALDDTAIAERARPLLAWLSRQPQPVDLELACQEHPDPLLGSPHRVLVSMPTCLSALPDHFLLELLVGGADRVHVRVDGCGDPTATRSRIAALSDLLEAVGQPARLGAEGQPHTEATPRRMWDASHMPVSRRLLLPAPDDEPHPLPPEDDSAHQRLVAAVARLRVAGTDLAEELAGPAIMLTAEGCTLCGVCVRACPEDALRVENLDDGAQAPVTTVLRQRPSACNGCLDCVDLCPEDVLVAGPPWPWAALLDEDDADVAEIEKATCARCGVTFPASRERLCEVCAFRRANPFGSTLPPGAVARLDPGVARKLGYRV